MGFFRRLFRKESRTDAYIMQSGHVGPIYPEADYKRIAKEAYQQNLIAYRSIYIVAQSCGSVPFYHYKNTTDTPEKLEGTAIASLLRRPNPSEGWSALIHSITSYYLLSGNAYLERIALRTGLNAGTPKELYSLRPDRMKVKKDLRRITGYQYGDGARSIDWDINPTTGRSDILHLKTFNPLDDFYGWAPTMSAAGHIDNSNDALTWNRGMLKNGARPGTLITTERSLTEEQYKRFREQMVGNYAGPKNAGKVVLFDNLGEGKLNVTPWGWNPKELDFTTSSREDARRIAWAYGVPPMLVGIPGDNTYSNMKEARLSLWEDTVVPLLTYIRDELNNWLFETGSDEFIDFDLSEVPALSARRDALWEKAENSTSLTINEKRELQGYAEIAGGDVIFMSSASVPTLGDLPEGDTEMDDTPEEDPDEPLTEEDAEAEEDQARAALLESGFPESIVDLFIGYDEEGV